MDEFVAAFSRVWSDITSGIHAPLGFRFIVQPLAAVFFAIRAGRQDAREDRPLFLLVLLGDPVHRGEGLREGWAQIGKVFLAAVIMDGIFQLIAVRWFYPSEALMVAAIMVLLPYLVFRGISHRVLRYRARASG